MTCPGLHCPGCSEGQSLGIFGGGIAVLILADRTVQFVAEHIWWIGGTAATCFAVAVAMSMALEARADRRGASYAAAHGILSRADVLAGVACEAPPARPQIAPRVTVIQNFYGADAAQFAPQAIRTAIPGKAGDAANQEGNHQ